MPKTIGEMTAEIRQVNIDKGWRKAEGGPGDNTFGDYLALLHSEISEALEAYRDHRLADATLATATVAEHHDGRMHGICREGKARGECRVTRPEKPEGVGSELADVLIRLLDMGDVFGITVFELDMELGDVANASVVPSVAENSFGSDLAWLHFLTSVWWLNRTNEAPSVLRGLVTVARKYGIDLDAEYERKIAYNRTRPYQWGGRTVADVGTA